MSKTKNQTKQITAAQARKVSDAITREMLKPRPRVVAFHALSGGITLSATKTALKPSREDIEREIAELTAMRPDLPTTSPTGESNSASLEAEIAVLTENLTAEAILKRWSGEVNSVIRDHALFTRDWLAGEVGSAPDCETPSSIWRPILQPVKEIDELEA